MSKEKLIKEYIKCKTDYIYTIQTYLKTFDKTQGGYVPYKLFPKQKEILSSYRKHSRNLIMKPRQAGVSTTTAAFAACELLFAVKDSPQRVLILANKRELAQEFLKKIKDFLSQFPDWMGYKLTTDSKQHIVLSNGSECKAVATSGDALRGYTPTFLIFDEAAHIDNGEEVFTTALASLSTGGAITLISTPNGYDGLYYKTYDYSSRGMNDFNIVDMRWYQDPRYNKNLVWHKELEKLPEEDYTLESYKLKIEAGYKPHSDWYDNMCRSMNFNEKMIAQELNCSFEGSGDSVISDEVIKFHKENNVREPFRKEGPENAVWIWEDVVIGNKYIMGVDPSRGDSEDFASIEIIDTNTGAQVLEYLGKIPPDSLADLVFYYGNKYNSYTVVDITGGIGVTTVLKLIEMDYKLLHYDNPRNSVLSSRNDLSNFSKDNKVPGFNINANRTHIIMQLEEDLRMNKMLIRSERAVNEMRTFIYRNGRPDHMKGYHDDTLMSLAMVAWVFQNNFKNLEAANAKTKAILDAIINKDMITKTKQPKKINSGYVNNPRPDDSNNEFKWLFR